MAETRGNLGTDRREFFLTLAIFTALLVFHAWAATRNWRSTDLPGNGFRQTQTAITALFIQREHNFSLAYPTPVLGKPWSIPFEFPLYQWTVVGLSQATGLPLIQAGRTVSLACLYLTLPAIWFLLGRIGVPSTRRLVVLGMVLCCPLYIFYARAFLIETMALMFSVWFLCAFVAAVERRSIPWLVVTNLAGLGAGLVKVTTFMLYLMPAGVCAFYWLWVASRQVPPAPAMRRTVGWLAAACALPFAVTYGWMKYADALKFRNPSSENLTSSRMHDYNFGTWETRLSPAIWDFHWRILLTNLMPAVILAVVAVMLLLVGRRWWSWAATCLGCFLAVQALFPVLYAWHEYYDVANAVLLMVAAGLALCGLLESSHPRWLVWLLILGVYGGQVAAYFGNLHVDQVHRQDGGSGLTDALRDLTAPDDVIVVAGEDWASMTPFYAQRRALMIRRSMENDVGFLQRAFVALKGESIGALVLSGEQRNNQALCDRAAAEFGLSPEPAFRWKDRTVYVRRDRRAAILAQLAQRRFDDVERGSGNTAVNVDSLLKREVPLAEFTARQQEVFAGMSPLPVRVFSEFGLSADQRDGRWYFSAHPDTRLWFDVAPGRHEISAEYLIAAGAYQSLPVPDATDGVEFAVYELRRNGERVSLFSRYLDPARNPADRGSQTLLITVEVSPGSQILLTTRPGKTYTRDWAQWGPIAIH